MISNATKGNPDRLGAGGPRNSRILPDKVTVVNTEPAVPTGDFISHNYYFTDETVRKDVIAVLNGTEPQDIKLREYQPELRTYRLKKPDHQ